MLTEKQFQVLVACLNGETPTQRDIAATTGLSLGMVNKSLVELLELKLVTGERKVTAAGRKALIPYKVQNAVIMAAGLSSRFAPISYERPKGVLRVKGEVLIERQIRQLQEVGIKDVTVVVGYKKEEFFYLEDLLGAKIVVNDEYASRNNNSTIWKVRKSLGNTYICSSDDYFAENPFEAYVYKAYYAANYFAGETEEWCMATKGKDRRITSVTIGGRDSWGMLGHVYWDKAFSSKFCSILANVYNDPETAPKLWEKIFIEHISELEMVMRPYPEGVIYEFDSLDELNGFDPVFIDNVDSEILDNICRTLKCRRTDIGGIKPIKQGLTNLSFAFDVAGRRYVYRHPGAGTDKIILREAEAKIEKIAAKLGIDDTFIHEDAKKGWKISRFIADCVPFDYHNPRHVKQALAIGRTLHTCGQSVKWMFDLFEKARSIVGYLREANYSFPRDFTQLTAINDCLEVAVKKETSSRCLCHNDFYAPNFLVHGKDMNLIDWEYAAMNDYASDLGTFICCSDYSEEEVDKTLAIYFGRKPTPEEYRHCLAYVAAAAFYWYVWALFKDMNASPVGEWLYLWYKFAKSYGRKAVDLYTVPDVK